MCTRPRQHPQGVALQATCIQPKAGQDRHRRWLPRCLRHDRPEGECLAASSLRGHAATLSQRGISLIELIMFIVIVSVAVVGILLVLNVTEKSSADPLVRKQALAVAQSLLEEIELQDFNSVAGATTPVTQANRATQYHIVSDYNGFPNGATTGIYSVSGAPIVGLEKYNASVTVANAALNGIAAGNAVLITVTVTDPQGNAIQVSGYRTAY